MAKYFPLGVGLEDEKLRSLLICLLVKLASYLNNFL